MGKRCLVCSTEESDSVQLRTDGICVATKSCKLRFAARALVTANAGVDSVESARLVCEADKLDSMRSTWSAFATASFVGAFAVAKANRTRRY